MCKFEHNKEDRVIAVGINNMERKIHDEEEFYEKFFGTQCPEQVARDTGCSTKTAEKILDQLRENRIEDLDQLTHIDSPYDGNLNLSQIPLR